MKKIINILTISLFAGIILTACSDYDYKEPGKTIFVEYVDLDFDWRSSDQGIIRVRTEHGKPITVSSDQEWCKPTESDMTIHVAVLQNNSFAYRTALISIKSGNETVSVPVTQGPTTFSVGSLDVTLTQRGGETQIAASSTLSSISVINNESWITNAEYVNGRIIIKYEDNPAPDYRTGTISVISGPVTHDITLTQDPNMYALFLGNWLLECLDEDEKVISKTLTFRKDVEYISYLVTGLDLDYPFEILFNEDSNLMEVRGQYLGQYTMDDIEYALYLYPLGVRGGYSVVDDDAYTYYGVWLNNDIKVPQYGFVDIGLLGTDRISGMALVAQKGSGSSAQYTRLYSYRTWTITKVD